ncbi:head-tail connector protein [Pseudoalteromonas piratica]|uniref:Phage gp6-like head-tail connector protein n=1 Tax=Pseudoalteromonas piratica TaxID=1348114 RepID=A0A0A7EEZ7_9GAMM|nr:head-tail connector protein [Pseudoalteromonas piratica]AIY65194.1 hypothetical protein OM33_08500 [Pseudoalteromonas piratica]
MVVELAQAKQQLNIDHTLDDSFITSLITASLGLIEGKLQRPIFNTQGEAGDVANAIVIEDLKASSKAALQQAILLVVSDLYVNRESTTDAQQYENRALSALLASFDEVVIG